MLRFMVRRYAGPHGIVNVFHAQPHAGAPAGLIDRHPIGVVQYGDVGVFADGEKRSLLDVLERDLSVQDSGLGLAAGLRALATRGMETAFTGVLSSPRRDPERQRFSSTCCFSL